VKPRCELARRISVQAIRVSGGVLIVAHGEAPTVDYRVDLQQNPLPVDPPEFFLTQCGAPGSWPEVATPYTVYESFSLAAVPGKVVVHHAEGRDDVQVEQPEHGLLGSLYADEETGGLEAPPLRADQAVGLSRTLSVDEAFQDAVRRLPPLGEPRPDRLQEFRIVEIVAQFGGLAGFRHLLVRVRREVV
jgi:hypothetical protein